MDCPHCGAPIDGGAPKPIEHTVFDDRLRQIVVDGERRHVPPTQWRLLLILRQRFRHFVPDGYLAQWSAKNPGDGGNINSMRVHIMRLRVKLLGTPFAIAAGYGRGYGLFPVDEVRLVIGRDQHRRYPHTLES